ncbi:Uncharacterised protein [Mycobacterium tuberculosis]|nr:Uncharacterised protein [Mycobacterium tuberculosis]
MPGRFNVGASQDIENPQFAGIQFEASDIDARIERRVARPPELGHHFLM